MILIYPPSLRHNRLLYAANVGIRYIDNRFETLKYRWLWEEAKAGNIPELERYIIDTQYIHGPMLTVLIVASGYYIPGYVYDMADIVLFWRHDNTYLILKDDFNPYDDMHDIPMSGTRIDNMLFYYNYGKYREIPEEPK